MKKYEFMQCKKALRVALLVLLLSVAGRMNAQTYTYTPSLQTYTDCGSGTCSMPALSYSGCYLSGGYATYQKGQAHAAIWSRNSSGTLTFRVQKCSGYFVNGNSGKVLIFDEYYGNVYCTSFSIDDSYTSYVTAKIYNYDDFTGSRTFKVFLITSDQVYKFYAGQITMERTDPPTVVTAGSGNITAHSARLAGGIIPRGSTTHYYFEYGPTTSMNYETPTETIEGDNTQHIVYETITGLSSNTTYYYRLYAWNAYGDAYGERKSFTTEAVYYDINVSANPYDGGSVNGGGSYEEGDYIVVNAYAETGYNFLRWTENGSQVSTNSSYYFTVTGNRDLVAQFQIQSYTITASANPSNGGSVSGGGTYNYGTNCTLTATPNTGYSFVRWTKNGSQVSTNPTYNFMVTENASYVAEFSQNSYTISVSANPSAGGTVSGGGTYNFGNYCILTATPNPGYSFVRWTKNGSQVSTNSTYGFMVTENASYVAEFSQNNYTISVSASPSNGGTVGGGGTYNYGNNCILTATPATGYSFVRWTKNGIQVSTNPTYSFTVTESASYVAEFGLNSYTVSVSASPTSGGTVNGGGTYNYGNNCTLVATSNAGYTFVRWTKNGSQVSTNATYSFTVTESASYVAEFSLNNYTVSVSASPSSGGTVNGGGAYNYGNNCTLIATPNLGYSFVRWTKNGSQVSTNPTYSFTVTESVSYVAEFSQDIYTISASASPSLGGTVSGGGTYTYGNDCTLTATPATEYTFVKWTKNGSEVSTNPTYSFTVTESANYVAEFILNSYSVSVSPNPSTGGTILNGEETTAFGVQIGEGTSNTNHLPMYYLYNYSLSTQLYLGTELAEAGATTASMSSISWFSNSTYNYNIHNVSIWMANVTDTQANTTSPLGSSMTLVYNGDFQEVVGWNEFVFNQGGFAWDGLSNVLVMVQMNNGSWSSAIQWRGGNVGFTASSYVYQDNTPYNAAVTTYSFSNTTANRANTIFNFNSTETYQSGTTCTLTAVPNEGYNFNNWTENGTVVSWAATYSFVVTGGRTLVANFSDTEGTGRLDGVFSVGGNTQANFSQGNLQYQASTDTWRFADNQFDCVGASNSDASQAYDGWIDLFGWGTSGYDHGAVCYQPWSTSQTNSHYHAYGGGTYNLYDQTGQADWGYNTISNGGNQPNQWKTLTKDEWNYVFNTRTTASGIRYAKAKVNNVNGIILLPDDWNASYYSLSNTNTSDANFSSNTVTASQWSTMEQHGAVFLPTAGYRYGTSVSEVDSIGYYWSASYYKSNSAYYMDFDDSYLSAQGHINRYYGLSVRLARVFQIFGINATPNPSEGGTVNGSGTYEAGADCTLTATPNEGYTFTNWTENGTQVSTNTSYTFTVSCDRTLVANFTLNTYTVTATASPSAGGTVTGSGSYNHGTSCTLTATANTGYTFVRWTKNGSQVSTNPTYSFTVTESASYVAEFSLNSYAVTATANPSAGGTITGSGNYNHGASCTLIATANTGYTFVRWTKNGSQVSTNPTYTFTVTGSANYVAEFSLNSYTITVSASPEADGTVSGGGTYNYGTNCTLTATPNLGYSFVRWTKNGSQVSTNATFSFTVTESASYVAEFSQDIYTVSVSANPSAGGMVNGGGSFTYGNNCTLTATANTGYTFVRWTKNGSQVSTNPTYSFTVTESASYVAVFSLNSYTVTATANPSAGGTVTGSGSYNHGAFCTLTATASDGYTFIDWMENGEVVSMEVTYSFTVTGDRSLVAMFEENSQVSHWTAQSSEYEDNMTLTGVIQINGVDQQNTALEVGVFCGTECRGSARPVLFPPTGRYLVLLTLYGNNGDQLTFNLYDHNQATELNLQSPDAVTFSSNGLGSLVNPHVLNFTGGLGGNSQTVGLAQGWSWWSTYIELDGIDGLGMLENSLGTSGVAIKSQEDFVEYSGAIGTWTGGLESINNASGYKIMVATACESVMTGTIATPSNHPITLTNGWTWIGYPVQTAQTVTSALSGFTPADGDILKGQDAYTTYSIGSGWTPADYTLTPGQCYMYYSNASGNKTLVVHQAKGGAPASPKEKHYWQANHHACPDNLSMMATMEVEGVEQRGESLELGAFIDGECRGSAKLHYVESLDRYIAFLTVTGRDGDRISFGMVDMESGRTDMESETRLDFASNAIVGGMSSPYPVRFGKMSETAQSYIMKLYPNPVDRNRAFTLEIPEEEKISEVIIMDAMGAVVRHKVGAVDPIEQGLPVAGVYLVKVLSQTGNLYFGKLVVD